MKRIGLFVNPAKPQVQEVLQRIHRQATALGLHLVALNDPPASLPGVEPLGHAPGPGEIDLIMALGGDGTLLRAVRLLEGADIPVIGVNLGSLGFMTSIPIDQLEEALDALHAGACTTEVRRLAECELWRGTHRHSTHVALNDIVIGWGTLARVVHLGLRIDDEDVTTYACDGVIVCTPTGSTGHSLSAGGPILHPETPALLVNVLCPHTLSARPLVLPDHATLEITAHRISSGKNLLLSVDGQQLEAVEQGDRLIVRRHPRDVRLMQLPGSSYFDILRRKLHWRGSSTTS